MDQKISVLFYIFVSISFSVGSNDYREVAPVKMLNVKSVATRYPASNSEFRTNLENGYVSL